MGEKKKKKLSIKYKLPGDQVTMRGTVLPVTVFCKKKREQSGGLTSTNPKPSGQYEGGVEGRPQQSKQKPTQNEGRQQG